LIILLGLVGFDEIPHTSYIFLSKVFKDEKDLLCQGFKGFKGIFILIILLGLVGFDGIPHTSFIFLSKDFKDEKDLLCQGFKGFIRIPSYIIHLTSYFLPLTSYITPSFFQLKFKRAQTKI